jgi:K+-sensing histidine kinase KdpD
MNTLPNQQATSSNEELSQNLELRRELDELRAERKWLWTMLIEISRRLQLSSTSIKAAVTSLLGYDIIWDGSNQHEFLTTIDTSVDQVSERVHLLALGLRVAADTIELRLEPQILQEIVCAVRSRAATHFPNLLFEVTLPKGGKPVLVDYEYLVTGMELILQASEPLSGSNGIRMQAAEVLDTWVLDLDGLDSTLVRLIESMPPYSTEGAGNGRNPSLETTLRLYIAKHVLQRQGIRLASRASASGNLVLRMSVPISVQE